VAIRVQPDHTYVLGNPPAGADRYVYSRVYPERHEVRLRSMVDDPNR
jgi:hypothetical protein